MSAGESPRASRGFRPDIEGLRSVAIGLVLIYHAGVRQLPGGFVGVDVFFVISGFLITGLLIRELDKNKRISLTQFYARRAKRLLPATAVVLVATAALTLATVSSVEWRVFGRDIAGAALYVINWVLAGRSVDYLAEDVGASPVQHFWSLAVEEQFYIVWPVLLVLVGIWLRHRPQARPRLVMGAAIGLVIVTSLLCSLIWTASNPAVAFFVTPTRLWELGIGALVAIGASAWARIPARTAAMISWLGLAAIVASGLVLTEGIAWPGYAALWPTIATAMVIVGGFSSGPTGAARLLGWRPAVWIGGLSYSLYLWHWPLIVTATTLWGDLGGRKGLLVIAASFIPAYLCYRFIENPIRFSSSLAKSPRMSLSLGGNFTLIGVVAGLVLMLVVPQSSAPPGSEEAGGAEAITTGTSQPAVGAAVAGSMASLSEIEWFTPAPAEAASDVPPGSLEGCQQDQVDPTPIRCEWGDLEGDITVAVIGDSKILQWQTALQSIAEAEGWHVHAFTKSACAFGTGIQVASGEPYLSCAQWNEQLLPILEDLAPDVVIVGNRIATALADPDDLGSRSAEAMEDGLAERWQQLTEASIPVVVLLDNPSPPVDLTVYECVADNTDDLRACAFDREEGLAFSAQLVQLAAAKRVPEVQTVDMTDLICPTEMCVPVIGNVLVYRQTSHLTVTYVNTLTDQLDERLVPLIDAAVS